MYLMLVCIKDHPFKPYLIVLDIVILSVHPSLSSSTEWMV